MKPVFAGVAFLIAFALSTDASATGEVDVVATWVARNCAQAQEKIFVGLEGHERDIGPDQPLVVVQVGGEFVLDTEISLFFESGKLTAEMTQAKGEPLCQQLEQIKTSLPRTDLSGAISRAKVLHRRFAEDETPGLLAAYKKLHDIEIEAWPTDVLFAPGRGVTVAIYGASGSLRVEFSMPEPTASAVAYTTQSTSPQPNLSLWVQNLLKTLNVDVSYSTE